MNKSKAKVAGSPSRYTNSSNDKNDDSSIDSNYDPEIPTIAISGSVDGLTGMTFGDSEATAKTNTTHKYDAATIRAEFKTYQSLLPKPDALLQEKHSFTFLRNKIKDSGVDIPRFLQYKHEGGIKPHVALCCLLLSEYDNRLTEQDGEMQSCMGSGGEPIKQNSIGKRMYIFPWLVRIFSCGYLHVQLNNPAEFIRAQFNRVANAVPTAEVKPALLRKKIKDAGLPVPNYFLDPEDPHQFPPHIALLVILQDGEKESRKLDSILTRLAFCLFSFVALLLRIVLKVIGGAG